ncbi:MAG: hypothetical protein DRP74_03655 [Candidatus Omnitrophota bacterium]|nr:MAG: hypothetical protein DRP74_03655 [Candidatus Omnitrophota bacterium]
MSAKLKLTSIEKAPLIRKFTVLFIVMSLPPFLIITYLYTQYVNTREIVIEQDVLITLLFLTGIGALVGFWGIRKSLVKIQNITKRTREVLGKNIPELGGIDGEEGEITQLARSFSEVAKNLENNIKRLEASKRTIQYVLSKVALGMSSAQSIDTFLELIVEITANALEAKAGVLMLLDEEKQELYVRAESGFEEAFKNLRLKVGEEGPGWVAKHKEPLLVPRLHQQQQHSRTTGPFVPPLLCVPLMFQDKLIGVLAVVGKIIGENFGEDELLIVSNLASQTAVAVENEMLHQDAEKTYLETFSALAYAVEARDKYSRGYLDRVSNYAVNTSKKLGLSENSIKDIKDAAELHDVGKVGISDEILKKAGGFEEGESAVMHKHPAIGEAIVKPVRSLSRLCDLIRHHHEWLDGTGHPDNLKGDEISIGARILSAVDTFDAMTTDRPYRKGLTPEEAKVGLRKYAGTRYDPKVVEAFITTL